MKASRAVVKQAKNLEQLSKQVAWMGDTLIAVCNKMGVEVPKFEDVTPAPVAPAKKAGKFKKSSEPAQA